MTAEDRGPARVVVVGAICGWLRADTIVWLGYSFPLVLRRLIARTVPVLFAQPGLAPE